jgi:hypothetical protein
MNTTKIIAAAVATVMTVALFAGANEMAKNAYAVAQSDAIVATSFVVTDSRTTVLVTARAA